MRKKFTSCHYHTITIFFFPFQNSEILSRKSSASSTGSLDRNNEKLKNSCRNNTPQIANSVKAKIAMFSSSPPAPSSISSNSSGNESSLTRSLTHSDVRFEDPSMQVSRVFRGGGAMQQNYVSWIMERIIVGLNTINKTDDDYKYKISLSFYGLFAKN